MSLICAPDEAFLNPYKCLFCLWKQQLVTPNWIVCLYYKVIFSFIINDGLPMVSFHGGKGYKINPRDQIWKVVGYSWHLILIVPSHSSVVIPHQTKHLQTMPQQPETFHSCASQSLNSSWCQSDNEDLSVEHAFQAVHLIKLEIPPQWRLFIRKIQLF